MIPNTFHSSWWSHTTCQATALDILLIAFSGNELLLYTWNNLKSKQRHLTVYSWTPFFCSAATQAVRIGPAPDPLAALCPAHTPCQCFLYTGYTLSMQGTNWDNSDRVQMYKVSLCGYIFLATLSPGTQDAIGRRLIRTFQIAWVLLGTSWVQSKLMEDSYIFLILYHNAMYVMYHVGATRRRQWKCLVPKASSSVGVLTGRPQCVRVGGPATISLGYNTP